MAGSIYGFDIKLTSKVVSSMELYTSRRPGRAIGLNSRHQFWIDQFLEAAESNWRIRDVFLGTSNADFVHNSE